MNEATTFQSSCDFVDDPSTPSQTALRSDLASVSMQHGARQARIIVDDIAGHFARVPEHVWRTLCGNQLGTVAGTDSRAWQQAKAAGWTRDRNAVPQRSISPLYIRIPLVRIDGIATILARRGDLVFGRAAVKFWTTVIALAVLFSLTRYQELADSIVKLPLFFTRSNALTMTAIFLLTKLIHESAHAIACRRAGFRCGELGVLLLCGVPCPYCDVTQVWRSPSGTTRAAVMFAGMYAEAIIASMATLVWAWSTDQTISLHALNVMIVCSVSTLLFNANPLMRYDGYYILSDAIGSVNLRKESRQAFWQAIKGWAWIQRKCNRRTVGLAAYHVASTMYRFMMLLAISSTILMFADAVGLRVLAMIAFMTTGTAIIMKIVGPVMKAVKHSNKRSIGWRKAAIVATSLCLLMAFLLVPLPRQALVVGHMDAVNAIEIYLATDGVIQDVGGEVGDLVPEGHWLVQVKNDHTAFEMSSLRGKIRVASLRSRNVRRQSIENESTTSPLETLQKVEEALTANFAKIQKQRNQQIVRAPESGMILPPSEPILPTNHSNQHAGVMNSRLSLADRIGDASRKGHQWCRLAPEKKLGVVFRVDSIHQQHVRPGTMIRASEVQFPDKKDWYQVVSVSSNAASDNGLFKESTFRVWCERLPNTNEQESDDDGDLFLSRLGGPCRGIIDLPACSLSEDLIDLLIDFLS